LYMHVVTHDRAIAVHREVWATIVARVTVERGIDRERGCMVVVRPDQYVAHVLPLDGGAQLAAFFDGFMTRRP